MSQIARRLSVAELTQRILEMGRTGVYRESIFEALHPIATKTQIRTAIAQAKQFGLHSVASLRDAELGTYYQVDLVKYQSLQSAIRAAIPLDSNDDLVKHLTQRTVVVRQMLAIAGGAAIGLALIGVVCLLTQRSQAGITAWIGALSATTIWAIQRTIARK